MPELPIKLLVCGFDGSDRRPMVHDMMSDAFPAPQHNHAPCIDDAVRSAREAFSRNQMSFTPLREKVFREIAGSHKAVGAYEVLHSLAKEGTRLTPISLYRIINTLLDLGVVRRFKSRNAYYVSCSEDPRSHRIVLACEICGRVADTDGAAIFRGIRRSLAHRAFSPRSAIIEVLGVCAHCAQSQRNARS